MRVRSKIVLRIASFSSAVALCSGLAGAAGSKFDNATQPVILPGTVIPAAAVRLKAAGLDPADAAFKTSLAAQLARARALLGTLSNARSVAVPISPSPRLSSLVAANSIAGARSNFAHSQFLPPQRASLQVLGIEDLAADRAVQWPAQMPGIFLVGFQSSDTSLPSSPATVSIDVPDCGVHDAIGDASFLRAGDASGISLISGSSVAKQYAPAYFGTFYPVLGGVVPSLPLGSGAHAATLDFSTPHALTPIPFGPVTAENQVVTTSVSVEDDGVLATGGGLGLNANNSPTAYLNATRVNTGTTTMTGTDVIGKGIALGRGVTAVATVTTAESIGDLNDSSPDNGYRGAVVTVQPQANRLQTNVTWHVGPGDSLAYTIQWKFVDPIGQRVVTSIPTTGPCDS